MNAMIDESLTQYQFKKEQIRVLVRSTYDLQKLRIMIGNRVTAVFKDRLGFKPGEKQYKEEEEEINDEVEDMVGEEEDGDLPEGMTKEEMEKKKKADKEKAKILNQLKKEYDRITDGIIVSKLTNKQTQKLLAEKESSLIDNLTELELVRTYMDTLEMEKSNFTRIKYSLQGIPIFDQFLTNVVGIGPAMAAVIISEYDIYKAKYVSNMWRYAGLDVVMVENPETGEVRWEGKKKKKEHMVVQTYIDKDGKEKEKLGIGYNPFLKTKLMGVVAGSFVKQKASKCKYRLVYDQYKHRISNAPQHQDKTKRHIDNMAKRYAVKIFLQDLYVAWRTIEGLEVADPYSEAKLGMRPHGSQ